MRSKDLGTRLVVTFAIIFLAGSVVRGAPSDKSDIQIEFPALAGGYHIGDNTPSGDPTSRSMTFTMPDSVVDIGSMRLVVSASWTRGVVEFARTVGSTTVYDTLPWIIPLQMEVSAPSLGDCYLFSYVGGQNGNWIDSGYFYPECPSRNLVPTDLLGLDLTAELYCRFATRADQRLIEDAFGTVHSVSVQLLNAVPDESTTWGAVKVLYR